MMDLRHLNKDGTCIHGKSGCPEAAWFRQMMTEASATTVYDLPPNTDCGERCYGTSLLTPDLPVSVFSTQSYRLGGAMVHDAAVLWKHVQCAAVVDSQTANRVCCGCQDQRLGRCPLSHPDVSTHSYCHAACSTMMNGSASSRCKELHAGCGPHLGEILALNGLGRGCSEHDIHAGSCSLCSEPTWCDDPDNWASGLYGAQTAAAFRRSFAHRDPMRRQCKWKPDQKDAFVATTRDFPRGGLGANENEVNLYVGPGDDGASRALIDSLLAFGYFPSSSNLGTDLPNLRRLADKFARLGKVVPIVQIHGEPPGGNRFWRKKTPVVLTDHPYNMKEL